MYLGHELTEPPPPYSKDPAPGPTTGTGQIEKSTSTATTVQAISTPFTISFSSNYPTTTTSSSSATTAAASVVHPHVRSPPTASASGGVNPATGSVESTSAVAVANYVVKNATTAEPHEQFCPKCQCRIRTRQRFVTGRLTWLLVVIILILFFPLAFMPFLLDSCKDVHHLCPKCGVLLAVKKRFFF